MNLVGFFCEHHPHIFIVKVSSATRFSHYNLLMVYVHTLFHLKQNCTKKKCQAEVHFTPCLENRVCQTPCSCSVSQCVKDVCDMLWLVLRISQRDFHQLRFLLNVTVVILYRKRNCCITVTFLFLAALQSLLKSHWGTNTRPSLWVCGDSLQTQ